MTWTKTGDEFADECWTLSDAAYRLHHEGLTWSNRKGLNGTLAKDDMVRWAKRPAAAEELVNIGWWEDHSDHYQIIHHIGYQRTTEQIAHQSIVNRANRAKGKTRPVRPKNNSPRSLSNVPLSVIQASPVQSLSSDDSSDDSSCGSHDEDYADDYREWLAEDGDR
jgi:hypothetical protein